MDNEQVLAILNNFREPIDAGDELKPMIDEMYSLFTQALKEPEQSKQRIAVAAFYDRAIEFFQRLKERC